MHSVAAQRSIALLILSASLCLAACSGGDDADARPGPGGTSGAAGVGGDGGSSGGGAAGSSGSGAAGDAGAAGQAGHADAGTAAPPAIVNPGTQSVEEDETLSLQLAVDSPGGSDLRIWLTGLPPGARFSEVSRTLTFTPDFTQGGDAWTVTITARNAEGSSTATFDVKAVDSIQPPWPAVVGTETASGYQKVTLSQGTDDYLDSPGYAGRTYTARVYVPDGADATNRMPVRVYLHGFGGSAYNGTSSGGQYRIYAHDPDNTYWWGYGDALPGGSADTGRVSNYTQRRVLHLLEWVLRNHPGADPERVYLVGGSMGGAGAATLGLLYARHFGFVEATIGQTVPRNHRPARIAQLEGLWGDTALDLDDGTALEDGAPMGVWDRQDLTRVVRALPEAREQFLFTKHGKDDPTIHFGAVTRASALTGASFYDALQAERIGHYVVWDEGGHGSADPVLGAGWWEGEWSLLFDPVTYLRRDRPFPAFGAASHDWDPGDGNGNGKQSWSDNTGFAGVEAVAGDTGWNGDIAGARNRFLRWDTNAAIDTIDRAELPLFVIDGAGQAPPKAGYPSEGDRFDRTLPVVVDVTLRRLRAFRCLPKEPIRWTFGLDDGVVEANADGSVTVPQLPLGTTPAVLVLTRQDDGA